MFIMNKIKFSIIFYFQFFISIKIKNCVRYKNKLSLNFINFDLNTHFIKFI